MPRRLYLSERVIDGVAPSNTPLPSYTKPGFARPPNSPSDAKTSSAVVIVIVLLAVIFFVCGILHLLVRFLTKRPYSFLFSRYRMDPAGSSTETFQRQLHQLFRLHDSGLDQHIIDALPVFCYKDIVSTKDPFDCAVCLCAFSDQDSLRLLPDCSHAFHVSCIDTWLFSNSTCPLCRGKLDAYSNYFRELSNSDGGSGRCTHQKPTLMEEPAGERRVYSVRLGNFRTAHNEGVGSSSVQKYHGVGETSSSKLDDRRCFSLGSCQYVIADSDLLVSLSDGKRISDSNKGKSFSVSKIWQWSKKGKFPSSSDANVSTRS